MNYWEKRKAKLIYEQMDKAELTAENIDRIYMLASKELQRKSDKVFDKFRRDYGLTNVEAKMILKNMGNNKSINNLRRVLENTQRFPNAKRMLDDLNSPAYSYRFKRFDNMQKEIDELMNNIYVYDNKLQTKHYKDLMKDSFNKSMFDLQSQSGYGFSFDGLNNEDVLRLLKSNWSGNNYSNRIWNNAKKVAESLKDEFIVGLLTGKSSKDMAKVIGERFNVGSFESKRIVRTESAFYHNEMEVLSYKEADIEHYRFIATLDLRTSEKCRNHDNKTYKVSERRPGVNFPPLHPFCRSTTIAAFDEEELAKLKRRAYDPKTGKNRKIPVDMSYDDWYREYVEKSSDRVYNGGMKNTGAIYGAWNDDNDPYQEKRDAHAERFYQSVRNRDKKIEIKIIAKNTNFSEEDIEKIYNHIFINEHELWNGKKRFDPSYDMAESWRRLREGKNIQVHDIIMLNHELKEAKLMSQGMNYKDAHNETDKEFNYFLALEKWLKKRGDLK